MSNTRYRIQAKGMSRAELLIYGDIGESWWDEESNDAKTVVSRLQELAGYELDVRINSYGGVVSDGLAIYNALKRHPSSVVTHIDGVAFSIASLIAMGGSEIRMADNALLMLHAPWGMAAGNAVDMRDMADSLDKFASAMVGAYVRDEGPDRAEIERLLSDGQDHYYTAAEAVELGLVDTITESIDIAAPLRGCDRFKPIAAKAAQREVGTMSDPTDQTGDTGQPSNANSNVAAFAATRDRNIQQGRDEGVQAENRRQNAIRALFDQPGYQDPVYTDLRDQCLADMSCTKEKASAMLIEAIGQGYAPLVTPEQQTAPQSAYGTQRVQNIVPQRSAGTHGPSSAAIVQDQADKIRAGMVQSIMSRSGIEAQDTANPWRGHSLTDLARDCLAAAGHNVRGLSSHDLAKRVLALQTTSDFPVVLEDTMHKMVLNGFRAQPGSWRQFCKVGSVGDLREYKRITPGLISNLTGVDEHGNYRAKPIPDGEAEAISAQLVGNIIGVTADVLINDDLNYIETRARGVGLAGEMTLDQGVYTVLNSNPVMADGVQLFHADHNNLADGTLVPIGDPTIDTVDQMSAAMAEQTAPAAKDDPDPGAQYLDLMPYAYVAHRWRRSVLSVINASTVDIVQAPGTASGSGLPFDGLFPNANPMAGNVQEIATSVRALRNPWYIFSDPAIAPVIEVVFLNGQQTPIVSMEQDFNNSGLRYKIEMPHGVGAIGWRGAYMNAGA